MNSDDRLAVALYVAGQPQRFKILKLLACKNKLPVTELVKELNVSQPTVSRHLERLKTVGLVVSRRKGRRVFYHLTDHTLNLYLRPHVCRKGE